MGLECILGPPQGLRPSLSQNLIMGSVRARNEAIGLGLNRTHNLFVLWA